MVNKKETQEAELDKRDSLLEAGIDKNLEKSFPVSCTDEKNLLILQADNENNYKKL